MNEDGLQFWRERFNGMQELVQFGGTVAQLAGMGDSAGKLAGEAKTGRSHFDPSSSDLRIRRAVKCGIDFD